jgi:hypothetical protein
MRFIANGPSIPDELLVSRDMGDVIFFCGAGVSQANAHLPNFEGLGRDVLRLLGAAQHSPARMLLDKALEMGRMAGVGGLLATDRVFGLLEREFEVADVRAAVAEAIKPPVRSRVECTSDHVGPRDFASRNYTPRYHKLRSAFRGMRSISSLFRPTSTPRPEK